MNDHTSAPAAVPKPAELIAAIARACDQTTQTVTDVLAVHDISLIPSSVVNRSLAITRLKFAGTKTNTRWDGPIDATFAFSSGVTALITEQNLRGKSTILELITWVLRGTPRELRSDVKPWLETLTLEYAVNGTPMAVSMVAGENGQMNIDVLTASDRAALVEYLDGDTTVAGVRVLQPGLTAEEFRDFQNAYMLEQLRLDSISNWQKYKGSDDGRPTFNGWPAYYGAVYLPDANSTALLGDTVFAGLPARLLQMFCNVPLMGAYIKVKTLADQARQDDRDTERRVKSDTLARAGERSKLLAEVAEVRKELEQLAATVASARPAAKIAVELADAEQEHFETTVRSREAALTLSNATAERQALERSLSIARETALAQTLFHGLDPKHCPRCESTIDPARAAIEADEHRCRVCTTVLTIEELEQHDIDPADADDDATDALTALRAAEVAARASADSVVADAAAAAARLDRLTAELAAVRASATFTRARELELQEAKITGRMEAIPGEGSVIKDGSTTARVLTAAAAILKEVTGDAAEGIFDDLNIEIAELGRTFGIPNLDRVALDRRGGLKVTTAGTDEAFSHLTGGERLRLRVAVVVALLRIGHRAGVGSHPGLILLDSPGSDELTVADERTLIRELDSLKADIEGLQVIIASAEPAAIRGAIDDHAIYAATGDDPLW